MNDKALKQTNRKHFTISNLFIYRLAIMVLIAMFLFACWHYCWYRWSVETIKVEMLQYDLTDAERRDELGRLYYESELAQYRLPALPVPEKPKAVKP